MLGLISYLDFQKVGLTHVFNKHTVQYYNAALCIIVCSALFQFVDSHLNVVFWIEEEERSGSIVARKCRCDQRSD